MERTRTVHQCLFCTQTFDSAFEKDDHTLEHFPQEICSECDRNLIRIGNHLYTLHSKDTCITNQMHHHIDARIKSESHIEGVASDEFGLQDEDDKSFNTIDDIPEAVAGQNSSDIEDLDIEIKFETSNIEDHRGSDVNVDRSTAATDDGDDFKKRQDDIFRTHHALDADQSFEANSEKSENESNDESIKGDGRERQRCVCDVCSKSCFASALLRHKIRKHNHCVLCAKSFPSKTEFKVHRSNCKRANKPAENTHCESCNLTMKTRKTYLAHMRTIHNPSGKPHKCNGCDAQFRDAAGLKVHVCRPDKDKQPRVFIDPKIHLIDGRYVCDVCDASLKTRTSLKMHKIFIHKELGHIVCKLCAKPFPSVDALSQHQIECQLKKQKNIWGNKKHKYQLTYHMFVHSSEKFKCLQEGCDKYFASPMSRKKHMETHRAPAHGERVKCDLCGLSFVNKITLRNHHQFMHLDVRNWKCLICDVAFKSKKALQMHTYRHTGEKPYTCEHPGCERKFRSQSNRDEHFRSHTGERPFVCPHDECNKRFRFLVDFRRHKLNAHGISSNRNFPCTVCNEVLPKYSLLTKHLQKHGVPTKSQ